MTATGYTAWSAGGSNVVLETAIDAATSSTVAMYSVYSLMGRFGIVGFRAC